MILQRIRKFTVYRCLADLHASKDQLPLPCMHWQLKIELVQEVRLFQQLRLLQAITLSAELKYRVASEQVAKTSLMKPWCFIGIYS